MGLNSRRATGPWVCKNCRWCGSISAPGFDEPTLPVRILAGRSGTGPYAETDAFPILRRGRWPHSPAAVKASAPPVQRRERSVPAPWECSGPENWLRIFEYRPAHLAERRRIGYTGTVSSHFWRGESRPWSIPAQERSPAPAAAPAEAPPADGGCSRPRPGAGRSAATASCSSCTYFW